MVLRRGRDPDSTGAGAAVARRAAARPTAVAVGGEGGEARVWGSKPGVRATFATDLSKRGTARAPRNTPRAAAPKTPAPTLAAGATADVPAASPEAAGSPAAGPGADAPVATPEVPSPTPTVGAAADAFAGSPGSTDAPAASPEPGAGPVPTPSAGPLRVCFLVEPSPFTYISGYQNRYLNCLRHLADLGCETMVVTPGRPVSRFFAARGGAAREQPGSYHGTRVVESGSFGLPHYPLLPLSFGLSRRIAREISAFRPDVVHASTPGFLCMGAVAHARALGVPLVLAYHTHLPSYLDSYRIGFLAPLIWTLLRVFHATAAVTLTTSEQLADQLRRERVGAPFWRPLRRALARVLDRQRKGGGGGGRAGGSEPGRPGGTATAPSEEVVVWQRGVDSDVFSPAWRSPEARERVYGEATGGPSSGSSPAPGAHPPPPLLLSVGRLGREKNLASLRPVLETVLESHPDARLIFVGDGPARGELEALFEGLPAIFLGALQGSALSEAYANADIFVMPSETETLGFVVLEAMASGLPVVAAAAGGIPSILEPGRGRTGVLYPPGDVAAAAAAVQELLDDPERRARVGRAARDDVSRYGWRAATQKLLDEVYLPLARRLA